MNLDRAIAGTVNTALLVGVLTLAAAITETITVGTHHTAPFAIAAFTLAVTLMTVELVIGAVRDRRTEHHLEK